MNGTDSNYTLIPFRPDQGLFPGYARIAVVLSSSIQALVKTPQQYERSYHQRKLNVRSFVSHSKIVRISVNGSIN